MPVTRSFAAAVIEEARAGKGRDGRKIRAFLATEFAWSEDMRSIAAPTFIVIGDSDTVRPEHAVELFRLLGGGVPADLTGRLPNSRLAILPGTTHLTIVTERSDRLLPLIEEFLDAPMPEAGSPVHRPGRGP